MRERKGGRERERVSMLGEDVGIDLGGVGGVEYNQIHYMKFSVNKNI